MESILDLLKILIPSALVLYGMYLTVKSFLQKDFEKHLLQIKARNNEQAFTIRLQAYERMTLFLERITLNNLVLRLSSQALSAREFHQLLVREVREEFNHNLSQQVYMSDKVWIDIVRAMEDVVQVINEANASMPEKANAMDLGRRIFQLAIEKNTNQTITALKSLKDEVRSLYA